jgi:DNA ligase-1
MVGALRVRNTKGIEFEVGSGLDDKMRKKPPKIGTTITYKYQ